MLLRKILARSALKSVIIGSFAFSFIACAEAPVRPGNLGSDNSQAASNPMAPGSSANSLPSSGSSPQSGGVGPGPSPSVSPSPSPFASSPTPSPQSPSALSPAPAAGTAKSAFLFIGGSSGKVDSYKFDQVKGTTSALSSMSMPGANSSFLAVHAKKKLLFAGDENSGDIVSYAINTATGTLTRLNAVRMSAGTPTHVTVDAAGNYLYAASYGSGHVVSYAIGSDGKLGAAVSDVEAGRNAHQVVLSPNEEKLWVPCLGSDFIAQFPQTQGRLGKTNNLKTNENQGGPRHLAKHPNGMWAYLIHEKTMEVQSYALDALGDLRITQASVPALDRAPTASVDSGAEIAVHPNGKFVYSSNRGDGSISIFKVEANGTLTRSEIFKISEIGKLPRHFSIDPSGQWMTVATMDTNLVTIFQINPGTGKIVKGSGVVFEGAQFAQIVDFDK